MGIAGRPVRRRNSATVVVQGSTAEVYSDSATGYSLLPPMPWTEEGTPESSSVLTTQQQQQQQEQQPDEGEQLDNIDIADDLVAILANLADDQAQVHHHETSLLASSAYMDHPAEATCTIVTTSVFVQHVSGREPQQALPPLVLTAEGQQALPAWAAGLAVPSDGEVAKACAAYGRRDSWSSRKPTAGSDSDHTSAEHKALSDSVAVDWKRILDDWDRTDRETWRQSKQLEAFEQDVVQFEGVRAVPTILLFLTLQEDQGNGGQRDGGGGRYKRLMDSVGIKACCCVEVQLARARAAGVNETKLKKMRPACEPFCHRHRLKGAWATRVNRGGKVVKIKPRGRHQQHDDGFPTQQPTPALAAQAMAAPILGQAGPIAARASPFQEPSVQRARRSNEETRRPPYEQHAGPHGIMESRSWVEADAGLAASRYLVPQMPASSGPHFPVWRDVQGDGDTPRAATKRPKNEEAGDARRAHAGPGYGGLLGEPQGSDDALSALPDAYDWAPPPAASPLQEPPLGVHATLSQSSEIGVTPRRPQGPELRTQWIAADAFSFNSPATRQTWETSPAQQLPEHWVPEPGLLADDSVRSPTTSWDAYSLGSAQLAPPAQHGPPYAGHDNAPGLQQLGDWAQQASLQPMCGRHAGGFQINGYGPQPHSAPQSYMPTPQGPMFAHQQPAVGQPAVLHSGYLQRQDVGNGQQWHGQSHMQLPLDRQPQGHPPHVSAHAGEHQAWAPGYAPPLVQGYPQGPPQHVSGFKTPSWSSDQSTPHAPAQPGPMGAYNGFGHADNVHASGFAVQGQPIGDTAQQYNAYGGAVSDPWQGLRGHALDRGLPPAGFIPVEGGAETAAGSSAWPQPLGAPASAFRAPAAQGNGAQRAGWQPRPAAAHREYAEYTYGAAPAAAVSACSYAPGGPPPAAIRGAAHGASMTTATARSGGGGSLPSPHQVGHTRTRLAEGATTAESTVSQIVDGASRVWNGGRLSIGSHASGMLQQAGSCKTQNSIRSPPQAGYALSTAESGAAPYPSTPPPTTSQRSICSDGSPPAAPPPPPPPYPAKPGKTDKQQSGGAGMVASIMNRFRGIKLS